MGALDDIKSKLLQIRAGMLCDMRHVSLAVLAAFGVGISAFVMLASRRAKSIGMEAATRSADACEKSRQACRQDLGDNAAEARHPQEQKRCSVADAWESAHAEIRKDLASLRPSDIAMGA
eukprot:gnl/TRDRNA2_/TRDRNA2_85169_c0_seq1.p1 gnl/TRDRNA2_/TRDRNA2_85169_c0~~gnl/TRDRNA2_/TRDRNA2_85169_c0_seq1.p1  ORF type:complete len:120 (+),score=28.60 gnl/TRDRNA2_/TRDRNA2_85169_c0_seq1:102-461(+)